MTRAMIENLDEKNGFIINILDNIDSQIKDELGNNHFSFLPFPLNASIIKIPIFKKCEENFICIALYEYDFKNKLIIDKENLYDAKSIPIEELKDYNKNNTYYKKLFNYLEKYIYRCVVERYSKKAYSEYFEKLSLILTFNLKELYSQIIPDKKISTDFFSLQNSTEWAEEDYFHTIPDDVLKYALWINENRQMYKVCGTLYNMPFKALRPADLQNVVDTCSKNHPTLKKLKSLFNQLYAYALKHDMVLR